MAKRWLEDRDREILVSIYRHGILDRKQVQFLHFRNLAESSQKQTACKRLNQRLVEDGYLIRHDLAKVGQYTLTKKGAAIVASTLDKEPDEIKIYKREESSHINHTIAIANFHINLLKSNYIVEGYTSDYLNRIDYKVGNKPKTIIPDGRGFVNGNSFIMEMDLSNMGYKELEGKVANYEEYFKLKYWREQFREKPKVIFVTRSTTKLNRIKELIENNKSNRLAYYLATIKEMEEGFKEGFYKVGQKNRAAL